MRAILLTPAQRAEINSAARTLPANQREHFFDNVGRRLGAEPTDEAVIAALNAQLDRLPRFSSCDSKGANE
jgi:hypothetical protein